MAQEERVDVVCLSELWAGNRDRVDLTKSHPGFTKYLPVGLGPPDAITYVAKGAQAYQKHIRYNIVVRLIIRGIKILLRPARNSPR